MGLFVYRMACIGMCCACGLRSKQGLNLCVKSVTKNLDSIGLDTWGVDFALLDKHGALLSNPFHYRDKRTDGMLEEAFRRMSRAEIFSNTGIQFMQINTLYQLLAMSLQKSPLFDAAKTFCHYSRFIQLLVERGNHQRIYQCDDNAMP